MTFESWVSDLEAVVAAAGLDRFPLVGVSQGAAVAAAFAARHPGRVSALVLISGLARGWRVKRSPGLTRQFEALMTLMEQGWGRDTPVFRQLFSGAFFPHASPAQMSDFSEIQRRSATPDNATRMLSAIGDIDIRAELPRIEAPTLVVHGQNDLVVPIRDGKELAAGIQHARFVPLETENHVPLIGEPAWVRFRSEIEKFLSAQS